MPTIDEETDIIGKENNDNKTLKQQTVAKYQQQQPETNPFLMTSSDDATINQSAAPSHPDGKYLVAPWWYFHVDFSFFFCARLVYIFVYFLHYLLGKENSKLTYLDI